MTKQKISALKPDFNSSSFQNKVAYKLSWNFMSEANLQYIPSNTITCAQHFQSNHRLKCSFIELPEAQKENKIRRNFKGGEQFFQYPIRCLIKVAFESCLIYNDLPSTFPLEGRSLSNLIRGSHRVED